MKTEAKAFILVAAMAGLMAGCASPKPKECKPCKACPAGMKSDKGSCGTKSGCSSKSACSAKGNCGTKGNKGS